MRCSVLATLIVAVLLIGGIADASHQQLSFNGFATGAAGIIPTAVRINPCSSDIRFRPTCTEQLAGFIKAARDKYQGRLRIRATRAESHTSSVMNCPGGLNGAITVYVDTKYMNKTLSIDRRTGIVTAQAGMQLVKFQRDVHAQRLGLPPGSFPVFSSISLGGIFSVAAHGSNIQGNDTLERSVKAVTFVDGRGRVRRGVDPSLLHGASGLLGIITEMTFKLGARTKSRVVVQRYEDDKDITSIVDAEVQASAATPGRSSLVYWRASGSTGADFTIYRYQTVPEATRGEAWDPQFAPWNATIVGGVSLALSTEGAAPNAPDAIGCAFTSTAWQAVTRKGNVVPNGTPAVGWTHDIQSSGCQYGDDGVSALVGPDPGIPSPTGCGASAWTIAQYYDFEYVVPYSKWPQVVQAIKAIYAKALPLFRKGSCSGAFLIRFGRSSADSLLAMNAGATNDDRVLYINLPGLRAKSLQGVPPKYSQFWDEWEQYMLCELGGRPHWGKNSDRGFTHPRCPVRPLIPKFKKFLQLQQKYDPDLVFEPELFRRLKAQQGYDLTPNCMSGFKCFCEADAHCPANHRCQPGGVYPRYRVCQPVPP